MCAWNVRFAQALPDASPFVPHAALADGAARTLARESLGTTPEEFGAAFKGSPVKRAQLPGLKRNAVLVLGNTGALEDVPALR